jgi:hypothetical protein
MVGEFFEAPTLSTLFVHIVGVLSMHLPQFCLNSTFSAHQAMQDCTIHNIDCIMDLTS